MQRENLSGVALCFEGSPEPPEWVELIPAGPIVGRDGRSWNNSNPQAVIDHFRDVAKMDLPVDVEHATELKAPKGEPAPAVGWVKALESRAGAVWGRIEWTEEGARMITSGQYRYLSPVILYDRNTRVVGGLASVGLTNRPNLQQKALNREEEQMDKAILTALGLPDDADSQAVIGGINKLKGDLQSARNQAGSPPLDKYVPRADYDAAIGKAANAEKALADLRAGQLEADIQAAIDKALAGGKITPATADYHKAQCRMEGGLQRFAEFCAAAPAIAGASGLEGKKPDETAKALNAEERAIIETLGITQEQYAKAAA